MRRHATSYDDMRHAVTCDDMRLTIVLVIIGTIRLIHRAAAPRHRVGGLASALIESTTDRDLDG